MPTSNLPVAAVVVMILPMVYFAISSLTFFLAKFSDPIVTRMLRGLFNMYFVLVALGCLVGTAAFLIADRAAFALGAGLFAASAALARRWFLQRIDEQAAATRVGSLDAARRLRRLQLSGMAYNGVQLAVVLLCVPIALGPA